MSITFIPGFTLGTGISPPAPVTCTGFVTSTLPYHNAHSCQQRLTLYGGEWLTSRTLPSPNRVSEFEIGLFLICRRCMIAGYSPLRRVESFVDVSRWLDAGRVIIHASGTLPHTHAYSPAGAVGYH